jgi:hypothetical protein
MPRITCTPERGASAHDTGIDVAAPVGQEGPHDPDMAAIGRTHEGPMAILIARDIVGDRLQQQLHHGLIAPQTRLSERRAAGPVPVVHLRPLPQEVARDVQVAVPSSALQRCGGPDSSTCVEERAVRPDAGLHRGKVAPRHILQQAVHRPARDDSTQKAIPRHWLSKGTLGPSSGS